jgi:tight adherence protein B
MGGYNQGLMLLTGAAVFGLVGSLWFLVVVGLYVRKHAEVRRVQTRLGLVKADRESTRVLHLWRDGKAITTAVSGQRARVSAFRQVYNDLGWPTPLSTVILGAVGAAALTAVLVLVLLNDPLVAIVAGVVVAALPYFYIRMQIARHVETFERQLVDALGLAARSLRAGHPLLGSFQLISDEIDAPVGTVFGEVCQKQALGVGLGEALSEIADRSSSSDLKLFAASVVIQMRSGGNLADMMERLADVMRDRIRVHRKARVLTAQTQLSKRILLAMPFVLAMMIYVLDRDYLIPLYTTTMGHIMLGSAAVSLALGAYVINRMAQVQY